MKTVAELNTLAPRECLVALWDTDATAVLSAIDSLDPTPMNGNDFLTHCTPCGGDWCGLLLSGIRALYPTVWDAIPDDMGKHAFYAIGTVLELLNITF